MTTLIDGKAIARRMRHRVAAEVAAGPSARSCAVGSSQDEVAAVIDALGTEPGRPMAQLLLQRDATVTIAHSRTTDLAAVTRTADILIVAAGVCGLIGPEHVKPGAIVIDTGIHRTDAGLAGDVRADEVGGVVSRITPVPGGIGPMTIAVLLTNTLQAARWARG